ncbi:MAG: class I SAM-dependent methyltransferase [Acidimicrobiales bacterium]
MSRAQQEHWDRRYAEGGMAPVGERGAPPLFAPFEGFFPTSGSAFEVACGRGRGAVWLADRGMSVWGVDLSPVAIDLARRYADACGVGDRCRFDVHDLDTGLPAGPPADLVVCYLFREADIDDAMVHRLRPGGLLAVACLSEVGAPPGRFRAGPGELVASFGHLDVLEANEADGHAWLIARTPSPSAS